MRPTWPLLALTLLQGLSAGMLCLAAVALLAPAMDIPRSTLFVWQGAAWVAGALGGMASFFHMHRLAAARYVLRRLGSSWLSREALSTAVYMIVVSFVLLVHLFWPQDLGVWDAVSGLAAVLGLAAVYITAMLYATIPAMRSWHSPLTVLVFVCAGLLSGGAADYAMAAGRSSDLALRGAVMGLAAVFGILLSFQARLFRQGVAALPVGNRHGAVRAALPAAGFRYEPPALPHPNSNLAGIAGPPAAVAVCLSVCLGGGYTVGGSDLAARLGGRHCAAGKRGTGGGFEPLAVFRGCDPQLPRLVCRPTQDAISSPAGRQTRLQDAVRADSAPNGAS